MLLSLYTKLVIKLLNEEKFVICLQTNINKTRYFGTKTHGLTKGHKGH